MPWSDLMIGHISNTFVVGMGDGLCCRLGHTGGETRGYRRKVLRLTRHFTQRALSRACRAGGERVACRKGADMPAPCCARLRHVVNNRDVI
jgi:hypothetical protein